MECDVVCDQVSDQVGLQVTGLLAAADEEKESKREQFQLIHDPEKEARSKAEGRERKDPEDSLDSLFLASFPTCGATHFLNIFFGSKCSEMSEQLYQGECSVNQTLYLVNN